MALLTLSIYFKERVIAKVNEIPEDLTGEEILIWLIYKKIIKEEEREVGANDYEIFLEPVSGEPLDIRNTLLQEAGVKNGDKLIVIAARTYSRLIKRNQKMEVVIVGDAQIQSINQVNEPIELHNDKQEMPLLKERSLIENYVASLPKDFIKTQLEIAYRKISIPPTMKLGLPYDIKLEIARAFETLARDLEQFAGITEINVTDKVKVSLKGEDFTITPYFNNDQQYIPVSESAEWNWKVLPLKYGKRKLTLQISTTLKHEALGLVERDFPLHEEEIEVHINPGYMAKEAIKKNWQWLIGTAVGTGVLWKVVEQLIKEA